MNARVEQTILEKLRQLPPEQLTEVQNFVDFLASKARRMAALDRLLAVAPALEAAGIEPSTDEEVVNEVKTARAERRSGRDNNRANRS
jgi:hypothetical protein